MNTGYSFTLSAAFPDDQGLVAGSANLTQYQMVLLAVLPNGNDAPNSNFFLNFTPPVSSTAEGYVYQNFNVTVSAQQYAGFVGDTLRLVVYGFTNNTAGATLMDNFVVTEVPEPGTMALAGVGIGALGLMLRRRRN